MQVFIFLLILIIMIFSCKKVQIKYKTKVYTKEEIALGISFALLFLVAAFRYDVGYDYIIYYKYFFFPKGASYFEQLTHYIYDIARYFDSAWIFFAIYALLILHFVYYTIKKQSVDYFISTIVYLSFFYLNSLSTLRQSLAVAIVFWGFKFVKENKLVHYIFVICVAMMAHSSAIVAIPIYFIFNYVELKNALVVLAGVVMLGMSIVKWVVYNIPIFYRFQYYISRASAGGNSIQWVYFLLFGFLLILYFSNKSKNEEIGHYLSVFSISIIFPFLLGAENGLRVAEYYNILYLLCVPLIMQQVNIQKKRFVFAFPFSCYYITFLIIDRMNVSGYTPYFFYFLTDRL